MPSRLAGREKKKWKRHKINWTGVGVYVYTCPGSLLVVRRGFRKWGSNVGVFPLPAMDPLRFHDYLQGMLRRLPMKRISTDKQGKERFSAADAVFEGQYPSLFSFLADTEYDQADGGGPRQLGMLSLWCNGGSFHGKLRDNDSEHVCYVTAGGFAELFVALDAACSDPSGGWRPEQSSSGKKRKLGS